MKKILFLFPFLVVSLIYFACKPGTKDVDVNVADNSDTTKVVEDTTTAMSRQDSVKHGEYMVTIMGCNDCHTPKMMTAQGPVPNPALTLSGHPAEEKLPPVDKKVL